VLAVLIVVDAFPEPHPLAIRARPSARPGVRVKLFERDIQAR
jgi:hypothetical protein